VNDKGMRSFVERGRNLCLHDMFVSLVSDYREKIVNDQVFSGNAFNMALSKEKTLDKHEQFDLLLGEAEQAVSMIEPYLRPGIRVLEIGGGVALVYALLRSQGVHITSLEPGGDEFGDRHRAGLQLLNHLGVDADGWLKMKVEDFNDEDKPFDLIFSYFVLEHVGDLERAFEVMAKMLTPAGVMIHRCPNYNIPFEPHYNIPLVPFKPRWTALFRPGLQGKSLWVNLQFTTTASIKRLCDRYMLKVDFRRGMSLWAFERVLSDPVFAARRKKFVVLAKFLRLTGLLAILHRLPPGMDTPMEFTAYKGINES
jgi:2-polyprenyl-3-methyl-5-hydroxy-6-metoxy-1,4-benzoquinol methylase